MRRLSAMFAVSLLACGGESISGPGGLGGAPPGGGDGGRGTGGAYESGGSGGTASGGAAAGGTPYVEPECPDDPPPPPLVECDPMDPLASCEDLYGPGYGCYTFLEYPVVPGCGFPQSGAICTEASTGSQGDFCGEDLGTYCEPGYMCVVGALGGKRCAQICSVYGESGCPLGLLCGETDVPGYGVCF